jgi:phosphoserine phosphatase RsbU/P
MKSDDQNKLIQDLFLLQRVAQRINANLDLDSLLDEVVNDVSQTFGCSRSGVLLKDDLTNELVIAAVRGWTMNFHKKGDHFKIGEYGIVGHVAATGKMYYAPDVNVDPYYQVSEELTRSEVDIPLKSHGRLIGVFNAQHNQIDGFPPSRIQLLEALAGHIATAVQNAQLFQGERKEKERMAKELTEARSIQHALFPDISPAIPGFVINGLCLPCQEVGGDWYDYLQFRDGRLGIVLADVSGKGMGAAMLMSSTRTVLRLVAETGQSPAEVLGRVNHILLRDFPKTKFVTMVYALLDQKNKTIIFSSAGHPHPLLVDSSGAHFLGTDTGLPLGIQEGPYSERTINMTAGNRLVFYSDGVTEAWNSLSEQYGESRFVDTIKGKLTIENLINDVNIFRAGHSSSDDMTVVMIQAKEYEERNTNN